MLETNDKMTVDLDFFGLMDYSDTYSMYNPRYYHFLCSTAILCRDWTFRTY